MLDSCLKLERSNVGKDSMGLMTVTNLGTKGGSLIRVF